MYMLTYKTLILSLFALSGVPALAADAGNLSAQYTKCMTQDGTSTAGMLGCISDETGRQDARLNKTYKVLMQELDAGRKKQLQDVQRLWIKYRVANCGFYSRFEGSMSALMASECVLKATAARADELEVFGQM